jgi:hypothetical protein
MGVGKKITELRAPTCAVQDRLRPTGQLAIQQRWSVDLFGAS